MADQPLLPKKPANPPPPAEPVSQDAMTLPDQVLDLDKTMPDAPASPAPATDLDKTIPDALMPAAAPRPAPAADLDKTIPDAPASPAPAAPARPASPPPPAFEQSDLQAAMTMAEIPSPAPPSARDLEATLADTPAEIAPSVVSPDYKLPGAPGKSAAPPPAPPRRPSTSGSGSLGGIAISRAGGSSVEQSSIEKSKAGSSANLSRTGIDAQQAAAIKASGQKFADYYLVSKLGQGGMGAVYKAYEPKLNRFVAIKVLTAASGDHDLLLARFQREGRSAAKLRHPGVVSVWEIGTEGDTPYLVMDYVEGKSLDKIVRNPKDEEFPRGDRPVDGRPGGLRVDAAVKLANEIARAVHYAHTQGIVHRDIKPANIIIDLTHRPMVTDFGLAKDLSETEQRITKSGATLGTVLYMAPEQAAGLGHLVDAQSDVYSLGALLFELLTGRPPIEGGETIQVIQKVLHTDCPAPSAIVKSIDKQLDCVCLKALEKDKSRRYASADDLAEDLYRFMKGEHVLAQPPSMEYKVRRWVRRRRGVMIASTLVVVALVIAGYFAQQTDWAKQRMGFLEAALTGKKEAEDRKNRALAKLADAQGCFNQIVLACRGGERGAVPAALAKLGDHVKATLEIEPTMVEATVLEAAALRWAGKPDEALARLDALLKTQGDLAPALFERGLVRVGQYAEKLALARTAALAPTLLLAPPLEGAPAPQRAIYEKSDPKLAELRTQAATDLGRILTWPEEPAKAALAKGLVLALQGNGTADEALKNVARGNDSLEETWWALAHVALEQGRGRDALAHLDAYLKRNLGAAWIHRDRLAAALAQARASSAVEPMDTLRAVAERVAQDDPAFAPRGVLVRGWAAAEIARAKDTPAERRAALLEEAAAAWKDVEPGNRTVEDFRIALWSDVSELRLKARKDAETVAAFEQLVAALTRANPEGKDVDLTARLARTDLRLAAIERLAGKDARPTFSKAIGLLDAALAAKKDDPGLTRDRGVAWHDLAQQLAELKEEPREAFAKAAEDLTRTIELDPKDAPARRMRIRCFAGISGYFAAAGQAQEKYKYAELMRADCEEAVKTYPDDAELWNLFANAEATLASWLEVPQEKRTEYYDRGVEHYTMAADKGFKFAHYGLGLLYLSMGNSDKALQSLRRFRSVVPEDNPEVDKLIKGLEEAMNSGAAKELDAGNDLVLRGLHLQAEKAFEEGFRKFYGYLKLCHKEEVEKILHDSLGKIATAHYNMACIHAQASIGNGGKEKRPMPTKEEAAARVDKAFEELGKALEMKWGKELDPTGKNLVLSKTMIETTEKDSDLEPIHKDPRWAKFLEDMKK